jgi:hypothetical protein
MTRDEIIIQLSQQFDDIQVKIFLEVYDGIEKSAAARFYAIKQADAEVRRLQSRCSHPLTYRGITSQYVVAPTFCRICGAEL